MISNIADCTTLANGVKMPWLGLGVWKTEDGQEVENAVKWAIEAGYRSIDTAAIYRNESGVGHAIKTCGIAREQLFITTKVWNDRQGYDSTLAAFAESLSKLQLDYVDLYLIHWPVRGMYKETWRALEKLYKDGQVRAIGVSNFHTQHLDDLIADCEIMPMVNQVEFHPLLTQEKLRDYCRSRNIQFEAWSPLMQGNLDEPTIGQIANRHGKSPAQIILRWDLQNEVVTIPKSVNPKRIRENAALFDFELSADEMAAINSLNKNHHFGTDPDTL